MDCKRVTVIRIGPVFSTRSERHHTLFGAFFVLHYSRKTHKNLTQPARNGLFCARMADHGRRNLCYNIKKQGSRRNKGVQQ